MTGKPRVRSEVSWAITEAGVALLLAILFVSPAVGLAPDDHSDDDSLFGVVYISMCLLATAALCVVIYWIQRGARNRHTKLPRPIKRRRVRGPLKTGHLNH